MGMDGWLEDHGGFFCGRCGRYECGHDDVPCKPPTCSVDVEWSVIWQTLDDSLSGTGGQFCFNHETRRRALEGLRTFLADRWRLDRIQSARRYR